MRKRGKEPRPRRLTWLVLGLPALLLLVPLLVQAQQPKMLQYGFESKGPVWKPGPRDAEIKVLRHDLTDETARAGQRSEFLEFEARPGTHVHYLYEVGKAPLTEEFLASLWVKSNRPNVQILARLVLPRERDPRNLDAHLTTLLRGDAYVNVGRWQRLELRKPLKLMAEQRNLLRAELKRDVNFAGAYVDQLILNVYSGPGLTQVWIDELMVGPVVDRPRAEQPASPFKAAGRNGKPAINVRPAAEVKLDRQALTVNGQKLFVRGIRWSGTPLKTLRDAGFNALWLDEATDPGLIEQAVSTYGFWLVPMIPTLEQTVSTTGQGLIDTAARRMDRFLRQDAVLCWDLGAGLGADQYALTSKTAHAVRSVDPGRPLAVDVWDGFQRYSRGVDQVMLGVHRWPLFTSLELENYRTWLTQRRQLAQPGTYSWTWVQTHLPGWFVSTVYEKASATGFTEPVGPQPEQIRLLTYLALSAGCRGLGFWSDQYLADSHAGRDRLLQMGLLNQELQLLEPLLTTAQNPSWIKTSHPSVKAAVMRTDYGVLCLPIWVGQGSQFVPGQAAASKLSLVVPQVPNGTQAWLVSPGDMRTLATERVAGGTKIVIPEFGLTAAVVFTSDLRPDGLVVRLQDRVRRMTAEAARRSQELAEEELAKVQLIYQELQDLAKPLPDGAALLADARRRIQLTRQLRQAGNSREAYLEAQRALRPLRILMRTQWEQAARELDSPVASPYALSYFTLPRHWKFRQEVATSQLAGNVLPHGDFEQSPRDRATEWKVQEEDILDEVVVSARRVSESPHEGKQALLLEIKPRDEKDPPLVLERSFLAVHSPAVRLEPGSLVRISGWVRVPRPITGSADGALLFDSAAGEALALRFTEAIPKWKQFNLYRRVPPTGTVQVTLALTGMGQVYFDDVRIEPLVIPPSRAEARTAGKQIP